MSQDPKRKFFDILAGIILGGFVIFTAGVFLAAAFIPALRTKPASKEGVEQLIQSGYRISSTQYSDIRFSEDDSRVLCRRVDTYTKDHRDEIRQEKSVDFPTGRITRNAPPPRLSPVRDEVIRTILQHYGFGQASIQFEMAVSRDGRELAFLQRFPNGLQGILLRSDQGHYRSLSGGPMPPELTRLSVLGRSRVPLIERLASPQELEWADAMIESTLQNGPSPTLLADRLISKITRPGVDRDMLVRLLCRVSRMTGPEEAGRAIVSAMEDQSLQRQIAAGLMSADAEPEDTSIEPVKVLEALLKRDWGAPNEYLKTWLLQPLQEGFLDKMSPGMRPGYFRYLQTHLDLAFARLLAPVVEGTRDFESAAAAWAVRMAENRAAGGKVERDPLATDAATERAWFKDFKARRADLFKND